ncbi:hypothetical protein [Burkholderia pyrrocinia]|uniref:Uncharacterized protein n=1 Tax=Burkholderia pyrrocinia TaxID=60550 RepID=A0ABZ3BMX6_BURPY
MSELLEQQTALAESVNSMCLDLFDRWCEARSVIPLAYLMHTWPIVTPTLPTMARLSRTLRELVIYHQHTLEHDDRLIIEGVISIVGDAWLRRDSDLPWSRDLRTTN